MHAPSALDTFAGRATHVLEFRFIHCSCLFRNLLLRHDVCGASRKTDEEAIRQIADAIERLNQGDLDVIRDYCDENADYVAIDGQYIHGRPFMEAFSRN